MPKRGFRGRKPLLLLSAVAGLTLTVLGVAVGATSSPWTANFDGSPLAPAAMPDAVSEFDIQVHSRNGDTWFQLEPIAAQHGADCAPPPATHTNTSYEGSVFQCKNHLMTALNSSSYGVIYLTPNRLFDFSHGGTLTWEMSTEQMSKRDWWDVLITPYADNMALPLLSDLSQGVDLQGAPLNSIHIGGDNGEGAPILTIIRDGVEQKYNNPGSVPRIGYNLVDGTNESSTRQTFRLTISGGRMKFERLASTSASAMVYWDVDASLPFSKGVVQFGHHSYTPTKDGAGVPGTRHWDNITINPAEPFTMIKADRRYTQGGTVNFASPAPPNAFLRFAGVCKISVDGVPVQRVRDYDRWNMGYHPEHQSSYFVPIQQGRQSVNISFSDDGWYGTGLGCIAKDFSIWSLEGGQGNAATSTPAAPTSTSQPATPTTTQPTTTSVPATATATKPALTPTTSPATPTATSTTPPAPGSLNRVNWAGKSWYLHGANLPWYNWGCDFGCGTSSGVSSPSTNAAVSAAFAQAKSRGINVVRWWVFPGDPWQITRSSDGTPTGVNAAVYGDLDAALALAAQHDIYLDLVLFSSPTSLPPTWFSSASQRTKLAEALGPMFARYKNNPRVMTWEIINEPEFDIWSGKTDQAQAQALVKAVATSVHANSPALVTVGSAMVDGLGMWVGQGLDYYQAHWYDYMQPGNWCARCSNYSTLKAAYGLDKPLVIGEFYAGSDVDSLTRYEDWYAKGFAGAWSWSLLTSRTNDGMSIDLGASQTFAGRHSDIGPKGAGATPQPTGTPTSTPSKTPTPRASSTATPTTQATSTKPPATQPPATPTAGPVAVIVSATVNRPTIARRSTETITVNVTASQATKALIDIEVYGPTGERVYQKVMDNQSLSTSRKSFKGSWTVPANAPKGVYTVKVGVFSPGWASLFAWNDRAATFTVR